MNNNSLYIHVEVMSYLNTTGFIHAEVMSFSRQ